MSKHDYMNEYNGANNDYDFPRNALDDIKKEDKGYYTWKKKVPGYTKALKIEVYSSGYTGSPIRNAITGERYKQYLVGSRNEDLFFKVRMAAGGFSGSDGITLFYDSPEDYERHNKVVLSHEIKQTWLDKRLAANRFSELARPSKTATFVR